MALHARVLLKSEATPAAAREDLFRLLQVDGFINGTNLADTPVWPDMNQPWILLFATNRLPDAGHSTYLVTLPLELTLNKVGEYRIDSKSARPIDVAIAQDRPWIWKSLSVGTVLDAEIVEKMKQAGGVPLDAYWQKTVGPKRTGKGYQVAETQANLKSCRFLRGIPNLTSTDLFRFVVDTSELPPFTKSRLWRPRASTIYDPPLVLIQQSPGEDRTRGRALLAFDRLAYSETFNGYSAAGHEHGEMLVRYLHLFVHSDIWQYYLLATSPEFGAERRRARKSDLDNCPFIPFERLTAEQNRRVNRYSRAMQAGASIPWEDIDALFAELYGLSNVDLEVIHDTLSVALPYETARHKACSPPTEAEKRTFLVNLDKSLSPFMAAAGKRLAAIRWEPPAQTGPNGSPYEVLVLTSDGQMPTDETAIADQALDKTLSLADETGATQVVFEDPPGLVIGIYKHYRYWTPSRARLLAGEIIRFHLDAIT
jgi:hypothetical protein